MANRNLFQIRRKDSRGDRRDLFYSPERDLAHVGPNIVRGAMESLEEKYWEPWLQEFMQANDIDYKLLVDLEMPLKVARALNHIIGHVNPVVALEESGFTELPPAVQMLVYARLGQVFLAAVWSGVKDVSRPDDDPPVTFQELLDTVNESFQEFLEKETDEPQRPSDDGGVAG